MKIRAALLLVAASAATSAGCASSAADRASSTADGTKPPVTTPEPPTPAHVVTSSQIAFVKKPIVFYLPPASATSTSQYAVLFRTKLALPTNSQGRRLGTLTLDGQAADYVGWAGTIKGNRRCFQAWFYNNELPAVSPLIPFDPARPVTVGWEIKNTVKAARSDLRVAELAATETDLAPHSPRLGCKLRRVPSR